MKPRVIKSVKTINDLSSAAVAVPSVLIHPLLDRSGLYVSVLICVTVVQNKPP